MKRVTLTAALVFLFLTPLASAQITKPIRYTWIVTSCTNWNCAAAALVMANGAPNVIALPTGRDDRPWLVLKRVEEGALYIPDDEPFTCEVFTTVTDASNAFTVMDGCHAPMILSVPDGRSVVTSLSKCEGGTSKRRAVN
jgi:hypothetical protein